MLRTHGFPQPTDGHGALDDSTSTQAFAVRKLNPNRDPALLYARYEQWRNGGDVSAYLELVAALDDSDDTIRETAENLLHRPSPRPRQTNAAPST